MHLTQQICQGGGRVTHLVIVEDAYLQTDDGQECIRKRFIRGYLPAVNQVGLEKDQSMYCHFNKKTTITAQ